MAFFKVNNIRIAGMSAVVPKKVISNLDYEWLNEEERQKIVEVVGVREKRAWDEGVTTSDGGVLAANKLMEGLGWNPADVDLLIYVAQQRDYILPNTAHWVHGQLGLPKSCVAYDVPLGCSGFVYTLFTAASTMMLGNIKKGILITGDTSAPVISQRDKMTYPLFGDAVTATALEFDENAGTMYFNLQTDGTGVEKLYIPGGALRLPLTDENKVEVKIADGIYRSAQHLIMHGAAVFEFAMREVPDNINDLLAFANKNIADVDWFVTHQANLLMTKLLCKFMRVDFAKSPHSITQFGNTSSASIPLSLVSQVGDKIAQNAYKYLLVGFGTGFSWGSCYFENAPIYCTEVIEYERAMA